MILLDTHVIVALLAGSHELGTRTSDDIERFRRDSIVYISPISFWEVGMLTRKRRISLGQSLDGWMSNVLGLPGITLAEITPTIAAEAGSFSDEIHGDPCDRILIATARDRRCPIVTSDHLILKYSKNRLLQAIDARR